MHKQKRSVTFLLVGMFACLLLLFFTHTFPPTYTFAISFLKISSSIPFFCMFFLAIFGFTAFIFKSTSQGMLAGIFSIVFLLLRMFSFTHWFFTFLLLALFAVVELVLLQGRKN